MHGTLLVVTAALARRVPPPRRPPPVISRVVEVERIEVPPPVETPPTPTPAPETPPPAPTPQTPQPRVARAAPAAAVAPAPDTRILTTEAPHAETIRAPETPATTPAPRLSAAELLRAPNNLVTQLAGEAATRNDPEAERLRIRDIAMEPTRALLRDSQHTQPAGTMRHDRAVAQEAQDELLPTRRVPGIGRAMRTAQVFSLGPMRHTESSAERMVQDALDQGHLSSGVMTPLTGGVAYTPCSSYRLLRVDIEVAQDANGAVSEARVVRGSGYARLDTVALDTLRNALGAVEPIPGGAPRRSRWTVEVSEDADAYGRLACGSTGGWTVLSEEVDGVRLRTRVRRLRE